MKILTVINNLTKGGTERAAQTFSEAYHKLGFDSRIIALYGLGPRYEEIKDTIPVWEGLSNSNCTEIATWKPDIIHIHSHGPEEKEINKLITLKSNDTTVIETNVFSKPSPWADKVDISFQLSTWALWVFNLRGGDKYNSAVVPYPIKCDSFKVPEKDKVNAFKKEHNIPTDAFVIGRIGQFYDGKWSPMLIDAFNQLSETIPNLYLLIINPPESILDIAKISPYTKNIVHIPRIIGDDNLALAYAAMDIMLHIALQGESFGMVLPEAILSGTPVVALSTPWADNSQCEVIGHGKGGYIVNSLQGIKKAIQTIKDGNDSLFDEGRQHIENNYEYTLVAKKALELASKKPKKTRVSSKQIVKILKNSLDKSQLMTTAFLRMNTDWFRQQTIYTAKYKNTSALFLALKEKVGLKK